VSLQPGARDGDLARFERTRRGSNFSSSFGTSRHVCEMLSCRLEGQPAPSRAVVVERYTRGQTAREAPRSILGAPRSVSPFLVLQMGQRNSPSKGHSSSAGTHRDRLPACVVIPSRSAPNEPIRPRSRSLSHRRAYDQLRTTSSLTSVRLPPTASPKNDSVRH
jgi:hypothetical protein